MARNLQESIPQSLFVRLTRSAPNSPPRIRQASAECRSLPDRIRPPRSPDRRRSPRTRQESGRRAQSAKNPPRIRKKGSAVDREWRPSKYLEDSWAPSPSHGSCTPQPSHSSCTIFKAPNYMKRYDDDEVYAPTVVTIGPFHFGPDKVPLLLYDYKIHCVSYLLARHGSGEKAAELLRECIELVETLEPRARGCYSKDIEHVNTHEFAEMLLQDGCFILHLLLNLNKKESQAVYDADFTSQLKRFWIQVVYDLLKLENQIPFFVVQSLFDKLKTRADEGIDLVKLALKPLSGIYPRRAKTFEPPSSSNVLHLLHLFHNSLIPPKLENTMVTEGPDRDPSTMVTEASDWIPSATVLQDAGIKIRQPKRRTAESCLGVTFENGVMEIKIRTPKKRTAEKAEKAEKVGKPEKPESFLDVTFENGVMEIPPLQVDDYTSMVFRNLIAFEQCYPKTTTHITTYARLMDDLINTTRDVQLLSLDGVLLNKLGSEKAAADLLNKLCNQVYYTPERNYLRKVITDVTEYYERPWHKWRAELFQKYFSNPWAIISVLAAGVLLLLTIEQAVFAGLSYLRPPS